MREELYFIKILQVSKDWENFKINIENNSESILQFKIFKVYIMYLISRNYIKIKPSNVTHSVHIDGIQKGIKIKFRYEILNILLNSYYKYREYISNKNYYKANDNIVLDLSEVTLRNGDNEILSKNDENVQEYTNNFVKFFDKKFFTEKLIFENFSKNLYLLPEISTSGGWAP